MCQLISAVPDPTDEDLERLYGGSEYLADLFQNARWQRWVIRKQWLPVLKEIEHLSGRGRLLDVGCSNGRFLKMAKDRGWQVYGTEVNHASAQEARAMHGIEVRPSSVYSMDWPDGFFDVVRMSHVLEHLTAPVPALAAVRRVTRLGGILSVGVPNLDGHVYRLASKLPSGALSAKVVGFLGWMDPPHHLQSWSVACLSRALRANGFEPVWKSRRSNIVPLIRGYRRAWLYSKLFSLPLRMAGSGLMVEVLSQKI